MHSLVLCTKYTSFFPPKKGRTAIQPSVSASKGRTAIQPPARVPKGRSTIQPPARVPKGRTAIQPPARVPKAMRPAGRLPSPPEAPPCVPFAGIRILTPGCSTPPPDIQRPEGSNPVRRITGLLCLNWGMIYLLSKMDGGKRALQSTVYE